jgi:hypothetical protein
MPDKLPGHLLRLNVQPPAAIPRHLTALEQVIKGVLCLFRLAF